jgi:hypothetical protein
MNDCRSPESTGLSRPDEVSSRTGLPAVKKWGPFRYFRICLYDEPIPFRVIEV